MLRAGEVADCLPRNHPAHRVIAIAICKVRDSGRAFHWKRVRSLLKQRGHECHADVGSLVQAIGTSCGMTVAISRMHARRARRAA